MAVRRLLNNCGLVMNPDSQRLTVNQRSARVSKKNPLVGLESIVLRTWLDNSPQLQRLYDESPEHRTSLQNAVRARVDHTFAEELRLRAQGLSHEQAEEFTRPSMWAPPTWPRTPTSRPQKSVTRRRSVARTGRTPEL
jgi:hypothetical protein